jgi:outer membrane murein-binding lipoprotein Lpp
MKEVLDDFMEQPKKRTTFITVLCILTFIGSGYNLLDGAYSYFTAGKAASEARMVAQQAQQDMERKQAEEKPQNAQDSANKKEGEAFAKKVFEGMGAAFTEGNIKKMSIGSIITALLCLGGAFMMWNLRKKGFLLYLAGTLIGIAIPFLLFGNNLLGIGISVISGFFGLVFCILYAVNLKDMK